MEISFEQAIKRLEEIVAKMEEESLPLDESVKLYEEGAKMAEICRKEVERAETAVKTLRRGTEGIEVVDDEFE